MKRKPHYFVLASYAWIFTGLSHLTFQLINKQPANETEKILFGLMTHYEKTVAGGEMTIKNIIDGLSLCYSLFLISTGATGFYFMRVRATEKVIRGMAYIQIVCSSTGMVISARYFFWLPIAAFTLITALLGIYLIKNESKVKQ